MKRIIDIPDNRYKQLVNPYQHNEAISTELKEIVRNGTPIPDNATNRDVLQIVFPSLFKIFKPFKKEKVRGNIRLRCDGLMQETKAKWLDEPYEEKDNE